MANVRTLSPIRWPNEAAQDKSLGCEVVGLNRDLSQRMLVKTMLAKERLVAKAEAAESAVEKWLAPAPPIPENKIRSVDSPHCAVSTDGDGRDPPASRCGRSGIRWRIRISTIRRRGMPEGNSGEPLPLAPTSSRGAETAEGRGHGLGFANWHPPTRAGSCGAL